MGSGEFASSTDRASIRYHAHAIGQGTRGCSQVALPTTAVAGRAPVAPPPPVATAAPAPAPMTPPPPTPIAVVGVVAQLEERAAAYPQKLNWKTSIVDLLKLRELGMDESQADAGAAALVPALMGGLESQAQAHPAGLDGLAGLLGGLGRGGLMDAVLGRTLQPCE